MHTVVVTLPLEYIIVSSPLEYVFVSLPVMVAPAL